MKKILKILWVILGIIIFLGMGTIYYFMQTSSSTEYILRISEYFAIGAYFLVSYVVITTVYALTKSSRRLKEVKARLKNSQGGDEDE